MTDRKQVEQAEPGHHDLRRPAQGLMDLHAVVDAFGDEVLELHGVGEEGIVKGHLAPDHRWIRIVRQHHAMSGAHELDADHGCDLVGTEDDGKEFGGRSAGASETTVAGKVQQGAIKLAT